MKWEKIKCRISSFRRIWESGMQCCREIRPGQSGQQADIAAVALKEHFSHTCGETEIAVYLERSVRVEQVVIDAALVFLDCIACGMLEGVAHHFECVVAIKGACP